jgi:hypothetical protein
MYLRRCLEEVRARLGETDLSLRGDGWSVEPHDASRPIPHAGAMAGTARRSAFRDYAQLVESAKAAQPS